MRTLIDVMINMDPDISLKDQAIKISNKFYMKWGHPIDDKNEQIFDTALAFIEVHINLICKHY